MKRRLLCIGSRELCQGVMHKEKLKPCAAFSDRFYAYLEYEYLLSRLFLRVVLCAQHHATETLFIGGGSNFFAFYWFYINGT